jgi:chitin synthase
MASQRPARASQPQWQASPNAQPIRPSAQPANSAGSVQFQPRERGDRAAPLRYSTQQTNKDQPLPPTPQQMNDEESGEFGARVGRKKSLVKPDREKVEPGHRQFHYRSHAAQLEEHGRVKPSSALFGISILLV